MAVAEPTPVPDAPEPTQPAAPVGRPAISSRVATRVALAVLLAFIVVRVPRVLREWEALQGDWARDRGSRVVGYKGINPVPMFAARPADWAHEDDEELVLWSGWTPGVGHGWFRIPRAHVDRARLSAPLGRDVVRAIDKPLIEVGGGQFWQQLIPTEAPIASLELSGRPLAYPLRVLEKVEVINDVVDRLPIVVTFTPFVPNEQAVHVYDPRLDGRRITLGLSGYFLGRDPLLYDRGTESFWVARDDGLISVAGKLRGQRLRPMAQAALVAWGDWRSRFPAGRLVVGADRTVDRPAQ